MQGGGDDAMVEDAAAGPWARLAEEHLARVAAFAASPEEVCRAEAACSSWREALQNPLEDAETWRRLCVQWYPTMAARVLAHLDIPSPGAPHPAVEGPPPPAGSEAGSWRSLFQRRFLRPQAWDADKQRRSRAPAREVVVRRAAEEPPQKKDGKFHPSGRAKVTRGIENGRERAHAPRMRACRRCGLDFDPQSRDLAGCGWHSGRFVPFDSDGVAVGGVTSRDFERRARDIIKAHNRKKTSRRARAVVFGAACDTGVERENGLVWRWSCCGEESLVAAGCAKGPHA